MPLKCSYQSHPYPQTSPPSHHQTNLQSPLLDRLPADLRQKIYTHVFTSSPSASPSDKSELHPLALLQTCKRIHAEAHTLAFKTHTFPLRSSRATTHSGLLVIASRLSAPHSTAIRSLSVPSTSDTAALLANALRVFAQLRRFVVKSDATGQVGTAGGKCSVSDISEGFTWPVGGPDVDGVGEYAQRAVARYAPFVLTVLLARVTQREVFGWRTGEGWKAVWPQLESSYVYSEIQCDRNGLGEELVMDGDAVGVVGGVDLCVCGCGGVSWTAAGLMQEGGRRVDVCIAYYRRADEGKNDHVLSENHKIKLVPGTGPRTRVATKSAGFGYDVDEAYWEDIWRRNGDLGARCRGLWRRAMAFENESYSRLSTQRQKATDWV